MKLSPRPATPWTKSAPSALAMVAPDQAGSTPCWARTAAIAVPSGSSSANNAYGSVHWATVLYLPGACSVGQVRSQVSPVAVGRPKLNGATRRPITVVRGTGSPTRSAISSP